LAQAEFVTRRARRGCIQRDASVLRAMSDLPGFFEGTGMPEGGWWEALWSDPARVLRDAGVASGMEAIDLCCGNGWFTVPLCQMARRVIAIDVDRTLLDAAQASVRRAGASNCTFVESDAYELPRIVRRPVDHVFLANAFHG